MHFFIYHKGYDVFDLSNLVYNIIGAFIKYENDYC